MYIVEIEISGFVCWWKVRDILIYSWGRIVMKKYIIIAIISFCIFFVLIDAIINGQNHSKIVMKKDNSNEEASAIGSPCVVKFKNKYYMVYAQGNRVVDNGDEEHTNKGSIGLAISEDGINWTKKGTILKPSETEDWDNWFLDTPTIMIKDDTIFMYYYGDSDNTATGGSIGLATSKDFLKWERYDKSPVLKVGSADEWDSNWVESPTVIFDEEHDLYHMYYTGINEEWRIRTGHATSKDGYTWIKDKKNPVLREKNLDYSDRNVWDGSGAGVAAAVMDDKIYLFYASQNVKDTLKGLTNPSIGLATSLDGSSFSRCSNSALFSTPNFGKNDYGPYNPTVILEDEKWKIWFETGYGFGYIELKREK